MLNSKYLFLPLDYYSTRTGEQFRIGVWESMGFFKIEGKPGMLEIVRGGYIDEFGV